MIEYDKIKDMAKGRSRGILESLGIVVPDNPKDHSGCPICGDGNNHHRFRFDNIDGRGTWICNQ